MARCQQLNPPLAVQGQSSVGNSSRRWRGVAYVGYWVCHARRRTAFMGKTDTKVELAQCHKYAIRNLESDYRPGKLEQVECKSEPNGNRYGTRGGWRAWSRHWAQRRNTRCQCRQCIPLVPSRSCSLPVSGTVSRRQRHDDIVEIASRAATPWFSTRTRLSRSSSRRYIYPSSLYYYIYIHLVSYTMSYIPLVSATIAIFI